ncbi:MAG TPA: DUF3592 domain-containing protein [Hydrogenophaga sp.]|uniref:DUF3592 domain-containing protein n=1 Tax=Hydrogenophaga sp. TaxID=1904254 RepID=UPI002BF1A6EA|nr:DUF3592 domain-containing protein [Hydrogenophaga sp.]HMN93173.1 DUF3592 domain-containing protein [Hydrogenophaga sp.]HMP10140.1 DUF3592 domain-containing protein [Hydrogenophaga sp.]
MNLRLPRRKTGRVSPLWLALFGLPFLLIGLGVWLVGMLPTAYDAVRMRDWQPVTAELQSASLERRRGSKQSITYIAHARYAYEFGGVRYEGERVAINGMADNIGPFWIDLGRQLERAHRQGQPVSAWVNPQAPHEAVLDRSLRWPLMAFMGVFGLLFTGVGAGLVAAAVYAQRKASAPPHPDAGTRPWLSHAAWATPNIPSRTQAEGWVLLAAGVVFSLVGTAASVAALPSAMKGEALVWVVLLFPLVGLLMLWQAFRHWRRMGRYGNPALLIDPHPAPLGGQASMRLVLPVVHQAGLRFDYAVSALDRRTTGSGKNRRTQEKLDWETEGQARVAPTTEGVRLQWSAVLPAHLGCSALPEENGRVWQVSVTGHGPAADFKTRFEIPVFDTATSTDFVQPAHDGDVWGNHDPVDNTIARERLLSTCQTRMDLDGALVLTQPYRRQWAMKAVWLVMGLLFAGAGTFMLQERGGAFWMGAVFASVGLLMAGISLWSMATRRSARLGRLAGLQATRHFLGLPVRSRHWPADAVQNLAIHQSYSTQSTGQRPKTIVQVRALLRAGGHVVLADGIDGEPAARLLVADIARHTGWTLRA